MGRPDDDLVLRTAGLEGDEQRKPGYTTYRALSVGPMLEKPKGGSEPAKRSAGGTPDGGWVRRCWTLAWLALDPEVSG
jgi:hypothetical protein